MHSRQTEILKLPIINLPSREPRRDCVISHSLVLNCFLGAVKCIVFLMEGVARSGLKIGSVSLRSWGGPTWGALMRGELLFKWAQNRRALPRSYEPTGSGIGTR